MMSAAIIALGFVLIVAQLYLLWITARFSIHKMWPDKVVVTPDLAGEYSIRLTRVGDQFMGKLTVGIPLDGKEEQDFNVVYTLNSGQIWLPSVDACPNRNCREKGFKGFNGDISSSHKRFEDKKFEIKHYKLKMEAFVAEEQYKLGSGLHRMTVPKQTIGEVTKIEGQLTGYDGVFGLSLITSNPNVDAPVWAMQPLLGADPVFSFFLITKDDLPLSSDKLILGGKDEMMWKGDLNSHDVIKKGDKYNGWLINIDEIVLLYPAGGVREQIRLSINTASPTLEEEGIVLPKADQQTINTKMFKSQKVTLNDKNEFACNSDMSELPMVIFVMGGKEYVMTPSEYRTELPEVEGKTEKMCTSGFKGRTVEQVRLGRSFMKKFYTRFNLGTKQVQIAEAKHYNMGGPMDKRY